MVNCVQAGMHWNVIDQQNSRNLVDTDTIGTHRCSLADLMLTIISDKLQVCGRDRVNTDRTGI